MESSKRHGASRAGFGRSSADEYDAKALAASVVAKVKKASPKGVVGTFYEPFTYPANRKTGAEVYDQDRAELRKQVRDFVQWLKSQGVI